MRFGEIIGGLTTWAILSLLLDPPIWVVVLSAYTALFGAWLGRQAYRRIRTTN